jgi:hypothetical protein
LVWRNTPDPAVPVTSRSDVYLPALFDPSVYSGVVTKGDSLLDFRGSGRHVVEVFLFELGVEQYSYWLEADGRPIDERQRLLPLVERTKSKSNRRFLCLMGWVEGPAQLRIGSNSPKYHLAMVRWTPAGEFEREVVPRAGENARHYEEHPIFGRDTWGATLRRNYLEQCYDRLRLSVEEQQRRRGYVGLAWTAYWIAMENKEARDIVRAVDQFRESLDAVPEDLLLRQTVSTYCSGLGRTTTVAPLPDYCDKVPPVEWELSGPEPPPNAPSWAVAQRNMVRRMEAITRWWVDERQLENGELGGGFSDDVELLRTWGPLALGFGSRTAATGVRRLADGVWNGGTLKNGYSSKIADVEHSAEPTSDTLPLRAALDPADEESLNRLGIAAACAPNWITQQPDGAWRFKSAWFNCDSHDETGNRAIDVHLNTRAMGPVLWHAYLSKDEQARDLIEKWAAAWLNSMRSTLHGKPAGVFPPAVRAADGSYLIGSESWQKPQAEWDYFQWSGKAQDALTSLLLAVEDLTGKRKWLDAAGESFQVLEDCTRNGSLCKAIVQVPEAFKEWRRRSGDARHDAAFGHTPDRDREDVLREVESMSREMEEKLSHNFEMYTSRALFTDRVNFPLPSDYRWSLYGGDAPRGDRFPFFAVTWPAAGGEFARATLRAGSTALAFAAYNFEGRALEAPIRVWRLSPGAYQWVCRGQDGTPLGSGMATIERLPAVIEVVLPPQTEVTVEIQASAEGRASLSGKEILCADSK